MTENEAIEILSNELIVITDMIGYCKDFEKESDLAIAYRVKRKDAHNIAISALKEVHQYREIGSVEECREAVEKQKPKKCIEDSCPDHTHYKCPSCGKIQKTKYDNSTFGCILNNCSNCGQALIN